MLGSSVCRETAGWGPIAGIVAQSPAMERVLDPRAARGQGRLHHSESSRVKGPFLAVNCGAVAEGLLESELFGHARGSFTGASQDRAGLFEATTSWPMSTRGGSGRTSITVCG